MMWTTIGLVLLAAAAANRIPGTPGFSRRILSPLLIVAGGASLFLARAQPIAQARHLEQQRGMVCRGMVANIHDYQQLYQEWQIAWYPYSIVPSLEFLTLKYAIDATRERAYDDHFNRSGLGAYCIANYNDCVESIPPLPASPQAHLAHLDVLARAYDVGVFDPCTPWPPPTPPYR